MGPPGSGKGTQAKKIATRYGYTHISTGDLLRTLQKSQMIVPDEQQALEEMKAGRLVPDWLIYRLAFRAIETSLAGGKGVVLDGAIRNVPQAEAYDRFFVEKHLADEVFVLEIDRETLERRLAARPPTAWGGTAEEGETFARRQHATREGLPASATMIDATAPIASVVETILAHVHQV